MPSEGLIVGSANTHSTGVNSTGDDMPACRLLDAAAVHASIGAKASQEGGNRSCANCECNVILVLSFAHTGMFIKG